MARLTVFNNISLDGFFTDAKGNMDFAHQADDDKEWNKFVSGNAKGGGALLFGRITYEMMAGFWPTPAAAQMMPEVAGRMNALPKYVFSHKLKKTEWGNTTLLQGNLKTEIAKLKKGKEDITILGSGNLVAQLATLGLIDGFQFVVVPIVLGKGRTLFQGLKKPIPMDLVKSKSFGNGNTVLWYKPLN
jgi:dihydrofolate reductase